ncbi:MAG: hypothetical protein P1U87_09550 [Verrucomicrobiales bacterium]|nr:hypothetical protein [Verrucomicrobiales bacterium]
MKFLWLLILPFSGLSLAAQDRGDAFAGAAASQIEEKSNVRGEDQDWFFLVKELRHLSTGKFWEKPWNEVAKNGSDPVPSIIEFNEMLLERNIRLVVIPVPPKGAIYPDKLDSDFRPGDAHSMVPFLETLLEAGVNVIDLETEFLRARAGEESVQWYCQQDAHFSPLAIERIAELILQNQAMEPVESDSIQLGEAQTLSITGDQIKDSEWEGKVSSESLSIRPVLKNGTPGVAPDPKSRTLILGDSHTLVFHEGKETGMHCKGAGLADQLSFSLGTPVDLVGVRGSGLVQARKKLFFHATENPGYWDNKSLVVWIFSARELTQSADRIVSVPLER